MLSIIRPHHPAGIPVSYHMIRNILRHHTPCTDHYVIADGHTRHDNHSAADPDIITNHNRSRLRLTECKGTVLLRLTEREMCSSY